MQQVLIDKYLEQLVVIKERGKVFKAFSGGERDAFFEEATNEVATLQLRAIAELLAFGFVLATGEAAVRHYADFVKYGNAAEFIARLEHLNGAYYPQPIDEARKDGEIQWSHPPLSEYLNAEDFVTLAQHCDLVLKPRLVGAAPMVMEECKAANKRWYEKIVRLLNRHLLHPSGSEIAYLFQMGAEGALPTCNQFNDVTPGKRAKSPIQTVTSSAETITQHDHLRRQIEYLRRSCQLYDAGHKDESIRLAVTIRVLLHDTKQSQSLLKQMGVKDNIRLVTSFGQNEGLGFAPVRIYPLLMNSSKGGTAAPFSLTEPRNYLSVKEWWEEVVWMQESTLTRREIILGAANKEGGAHVDALPPDHVKELRRGLTTISSVKINGIEMGSPDNYHFVLVRQFAHELLHSRDLVESTT